MYNLERLYQICFYLSIDEIDPDPSSKPNKQIKKLSEKGMKPLFHAFTLSYQKLIATPASYLTATFVFTVLLLPFASFMEVMMVQFPFFFAVIFPVVLFTLAMLLSLDL